MVEHRVHGGPARLGGEVERTVLDPGAFCKFAVFRWGHGKGQLHAAVHDRVSNRGFVVLDVPGHGFVERREHSRVLVKCFKSECSARGVVLPDAPWAGAVGRLKKRGRVGAFGDDFDEGEALVDLGRGVLEAELDDIVGHLDGVVEEIEKLTVRKMVVVVECGLERVDHIGGGYGHTVVKDGAVAKEHIDDDVGGIEKLLREARLCGAGRWVHDGEALIHVPQCSGVLKGTGRERAQAVASEWRAEGDVEVACGDGEVEHLGNREAVRVW